MKRTWLYWLVAVCLLGMVGVGSLWGYRQYKRKRDQMWESAGKLPLARSLGDEEMMRFLVGENNILHSEKILLPVVRQLNLVEAFHVSDEAAAMERLRERSEVRKVDSSSVVLSFRDHDRELAGKISSVLGGVFVRAHNTPGATDDGSSGF